MGKRSSRSEKADSENADETVVEFDPDTIVPANTRVRVLYDDGRYYAGRVRNFNETTSQYRVTFDDGDRIYVRLPDADIQILGPHPPSASAKPARRPFTPAPDMDKALLARLLRDPSVEDWDRREARGLGRPGCAELVRSSGEVAAADSSAGLPRLDIRVEPAILRLAVADWQSTVVDLVPLDWPASPTVSVLLETYAQRSRACEPVPDVGDGVAITLTHRKRFAAELAACFDQVLEPMLLYNAQEKEQARRYRASKDSSPPAAGAGAGAWAWSKAAGLPHLVRLLLRMPELVQESRGGAKAQLASLANDLLRHLASTQP